MKKSLENFRKKFDNELTEKQKQKIVGGAGGDNDIVSGDDNSNQWHEPGSGGTSQSNGDLIFNNIK